MQYILKKTADNYTTSPFINVQYQTVVMENWVTCTLGVFLALFCSRCESSGRFGQYSGSYVSHGEITKATAINLTCIALYGTRFTLSWKPVHEDSWNASLITSFVIKYSKRKDIEYSRPNRQTVITLIRTEWNAYEIDEVEPEENYMVIMSATRLNGPDLISNTIILNTGKEYEPKGVSISEGLLVSLLLIGWMATITMCVRQVNKIGNAVTFKERFVGFRRRKPRNLSRVIIVKNSKDSCINTGRTSLSAAPLAKAEEFTEDDIRLVEVKVDLQEEIA
ncbi:uncharacterized protein [Apostichopus japonicus]|uniref:uncharacterized protein isoform X3 n=1 Tax=Stichopus japonicus TaxID=307972 RepID=UPI003AB232C6